MPFHGTLSDKSINLPILGAVSLTTVIIGGIALFLLFGRRRAKTITKTF